MLNKLVMPSKHSGSTKQSRLDKLFHFCAQSHFISGQTALHTATFTNPV